ncbi:hypothetical protein [Streptomyces gilvosporeus]|uniref:Lipoprotein n=1 Tax=Streptomyces gilvosporeus TaxID=553510 RepID=A0A1V0TT05_9ACTN|nr:hypothetical protein [Streptomyces gilvosporeus]ARF56023.1 hypothetical protein B1H19_19160 [Streptomyces gilvosporeus]
MRKAAQIVGAAAVAAMLLSGCGSSGDKGADKGSDSAPSKAPESGASTPGGQATGGKALDGAWKAGSAQSPLVLVVAHGTVALADGHKTACMGKVQEMAGMTMAALKCTKGDNSRTMGTLKPGADGKTLTVHWKNGPTEQYTKSTDGSVKIPDMPNLPSMPSS